MRKDRGLTVLKEKAHDPFRERSTFRFRHSSYSTGDQRIENPVIIAIILLIHRLLEVSHRLYFE